jgi:GntR family transcriptional regulator/MocR family aminotransferase
LKKPAKTPRIEISLDDSSLLGVQLRERLRDAIVIGRLPRGVRLPASRNLARQLGVSRNTVLFAYEELAADELLAGRVGSGTRVKGGGRTAAICDPDGLTVRCISR